MKPLLVVLLLSASLALAQDSKPTDNSKHDKGGVTVRGCVSRSNGDYVLMKEEPGTSYELQGTGKVKLRHYLGQHVEVTGDEGPSLTTSSDAMAKEGSASSVTITVRSIKVLDKQCQAR